jgi:hypothetical protein
MREAEGERRCGSNIERHVGDDAGHQRLVYEVLAEDRTTTDVMHDFGQRGAHHPGRCHCTIEPRQRHHFQDRADALVGLTEQEAIGVGELDLARCIGAIADLVLQPLEPQAVAAAVFQQSRHEEASHALARLASMTKASLIGADMNHLWPVSR